MSIPGYDIIKNGRNYEVYKDGEYICSGSSEQELRDGIKEAEEEKTNLKNTINKSTTKNKYRVTWTVINRDDKGEYNSIEVEAENEKEAREKANITGNRVRDIQVIKLEAVNNSFAEDFKLYETMWDNLNEWKAIGVNQNHTNSNSQANNSVTTPSIKSKQEILGCDLEETIDHMSNLGRLPKLPIFWTIDDIDDSDTDSRIMFSHNKLPLSVQIWAKYYYEDNNWSNCYYKFNYEVSIDGNTWEHDEETFRPNPEELIKRFFEIANKFNDLFQSSRNNGFKDLKKLLKASGYKTN